MAQVPNNNTDSTTQNSWIKTMGQAISTAAAYQTGQYKAKSLQLNYEANIRRQALNKKIAKMYERRNASKIERVRKQHIQDQKKEIAQVEGSLAGRGIDISSASAMSIINDVVGKFEREDLTISSNFDEWVFQNKIKALNTDSNFAEQNMKNRAELESTKILQTLRLANNLRKTGK